MIITFTKKGAGWYNNRVNRDIKLLGDGVSKLIKSIDKIDIGSLSSKYDRVNFAKPSSIYMLDDGDILRLTNLVAYNRKEKEFKKICLKCGKVKNLSDFMKKGRKMGTMNNKVIRQDYPYCIECRHNYTK